MMSQRYSLFYAGYSAASPTFYFRHLSFLERAGGLTPERANAHFGSMPPSFRTLAEDHADCLLKAAEIATGLRIETPQSPSSHIEYAEWLKGYVDAVEKKYPMSRIDYYYFFYGRKLGEIYSNACLASCFCRLLAADPGSELLLSRIDSSIKDIQFVLFKLIAAAALLSSEPRLNIFNQFYRQISSSFEPLSKTDFAVLDAAGLQTFATELEKFSEVVIEGYRKCSDLLKEIGV